MDDELPDEYRESYEIAQRFLDSPETYRAFGELAADRERWRRAVESGQDGLRDAGFDVPDGLAVDLYEGRPNPLEWTPWVITLTRCRTYKRLDRTKKPPAIEDVTICLGIQVSPNPVPGGPWG